MSLIVARTGRHLQRYDNNLRLVSGCIPYRLAKTEDQNRIEVLMVSSPKRDDMVFPKGGWESDETVEEAACREALEEAGVRGIIKVGCFCCMLILANVVILVTNMSQLGIIDCLLCKI